jgi:hypothetical protein
MTLSASRTAFAALITAGSMAASAEPSTAGPPIGPHAPWAGAPSAAVLVSDDWDERRDRRRYRDYDNDYRVVDAPFAYVETGPRGRVAVDAPFASVRVGRRGTWVRAPFVNLFVPR